MTYEIRCAVRSLPQLAPQKEVLFILCRILHDPISPVCALREHRSDVRAIPPYG